MKFRFCGDGDCPDWILAEIISTLSLLTTQQLESLTVLVVNRIKGKTFEENEIKSLTNSLPGEGKPAVACIHFLVVNAVRYDAYDSVFVEEIQQLGLPKDHAIALGQVVISNVDEIRVQIKKKKLKLNELCSVRYIPDIGSSMDCSRFEFITSKDSGETKAEVINIDTAQLKVLINEMKLARNLMHKYAIKDNVI